jgi:hypothetical protein
MTVTGKSLLILLVMLSGCPLEKALARDGPADAKVDDQQTLYFRKVGEQRFLDPQAGNQSVNENVYHFLYRWGDYLADRPFVLNRLGLELHLDGTVVSSSANSIIKVAVTRNGVTIYSEEVYSLPPVPSGERPIDILTDEVIYPGIAFNRGDELAFYFLGIQNLSPCRFRYNGTGDRDESHMIISLGDVDDPYVQVNPVSIVLSVEEGASADTSFEITNWGFDRLHYVLDLPQGQQILSYGDMEDPANTWAISEQFDQDLFNVRFSPAQICTLTSARMLFSPDGTLGQPDLVVYVWDDSSGFPGAKLDSVAIPNGSINLFPSWQLVYFAGQGIRIRPHQDFHIGYTIAEQTDGDALAIVSDDGLPVGDERRSSGKWEEGWQTLYDRHDQDVNFFIQAVVRYGDQPAWLDHDPPPGSLPPYATHQINLHLDAAGLNSGVYKSGVIIDNDSPDPSVLLPVIFRVGQTEIDAGGVGERPQHHGLLGSYPNPFNAETRIRYRVGDGEGGSPFVRLVIYNTLGQRVRQLIARHHPPGRHDVRWDGRNDAGQPVASGLYLCRLQVGSYRDTRKIVLMK